MRPAVVGAVALVAATLAAAGCETREHVVEQRLRGAINGYPRDETSTGTRPPTPAATETAAASSASSPPPPRASGPSTIESASDRVRVGLLPRGSVPYDRFTLPLVSPDGRFVATQTGLPVALPVLLASPSVEDGAGVPRGTRIEIFALPDASKAEPEDAGVLNGPYLLGRGGNADGFLVEAPRDDGSRSIGRAAWNGGAISWLLDEPGMVSAFAADGPRGRLAWSSRAVGAAHFDLKVRTPRGTFTLPADDGDWLLPRFDDADGLFALRLEDGRLDLVHCTGADRTSAERTMQRETLQSKGANVELAYSIVSATAADAASATGAIAFYHPGRGAAAVWTPGGAPIVLDRGSHAAALDPDDPEVVLAVMSDDLLRCRRDDLRRRSRLIRGTHVPRRTAAADRPWVLLAPESGRIGLTLMQILPVETQASVGSRTP